jgi:hypothetical protein
METLLQNAKIDISKFKRTLPRIAANLMSGLSEPCYYPEHKKYYFQFLNYAGVTEKDTKQIAKRFWKGMPERLWLLHKDETSLFYISLMSEFLNQKQPLMFNNLMLLQGIRLYTNIMYKQMKYCNEDAFRYALENIAKTHLFAREKTIGNAIYFISHEMVRKFTKGIRDLDKEQISKFITEYRHRLSQSIKSFATLYYKAQKEGLGIKVEKEPDEETGEVFQVQSQDRIDRLAEEMVKKISVYKVVDKVAMAKAKQLTKINMSLAVLIANESTNIKYTDNLRIIYKMFLKDVTTVKKLCGTDFIPYVRKLMGVKRTKERVYFKQQVNILLADVLKEINYSEKYETLTNQTKFSINSFLAFYLALVLRTHVCGSTQAFKRRNQRMG